MALACVTVSINFELFEGVLFESITNLSSWLFDIRAKIIQQDSYGDVEVRECHSGFHFEKFSTTTHICLENNGWHIDEEFIDIQQLIETIPTMKATICNLVNNHTRRPIASALLTFFFTGPINSFRVQVLGMKNLSCCYCLNLRHKRWHQLQIALGKST